MRFALTKHTVFALLTYKSVAAPDGGPGRFEIGNLK
jgi:hypothetical protein